MLLEKGQVFVLKYKMIDGTINTQYYRSDGNDFKGSESTEEFILK